MRGFGRWWVFRIDRAELDAALANSCRMSLARLTVVPGAYEIQTSRETFFLTVARRYRGFALDFRGAWSTTQRGALLKKLIGKQFEPIIPRLRITQRRRR